MTLDIYMVETKILIVLTYRSKNWILGRFGCWGFCFGFEHARGEGITLQKGKTVPL